MIVASGSGSGLRVARVEAPPAWRALIVMPGESLATSEARAVLPANYTRQDVVANIQGALLLGLAFAQGRGDLLQAAMTDRIHQPYRAAICPLLSPLLPLAGQAGILGAALSGAGPSVLLIVESDRIFEARDTVEAASLPPVEIIETGFTSAGAALCWNEQHASELHPPLVITSAIT
ncbi:MAG TPA: hypothetical protein VIM62_10875, partial [Acidobacteriaceae bacterium]